MIDTHCHILYGVDDGPPDLQTSMDMAAIAVEDGIRTLVATPHIHDATLSPAMIRDKVEALNAHLADRGLPLTVVPGGEVASYVPLRILKTYSINDKGYVLLEFPHSHLPASARDTIRHVMLDGLKVVIAHPERNPTVIRNPGALAGLVAETGAYVQITAHSVTGAFGPGIRRCARHLLKMNLVDVIASDAHSAGVRKPILSEALAVAWKILGKDKALRLVADNPRALIKGEPIRL